MGYFSKNASLSHLWRFFLLPLVIFFLGATTSYAVFTAPQYGGYINDSANLLSSTQRTQLEQRLVEFEKTTSNEIAVVITNDFQGLDAFTYSQSLFDSWQVGKADKNNGIIIAIGPKQGYPFPERGDLFINVGKGLEGALTDSMAGRIRDEMIPLIKTRDFYGAVDLAITNIQLAIKGEYTAVNSDGKAVGDQVTGFFSILFMFCMFFLSYVASFLARSKSWWAGGVIGAVGGVILSSFYFSGLMIVGFAAVTSFLGLFFDYKISKNYQIRKEKGLPTNFWSSGGGFFGGRGGFGGGGGFGGFGGGHSGGGGSGGGW